MRKGAGLLAGTYRRINPVALEEAVRNLGQLRRERGIGGEHRLACIVPWDCALLHFR
jgi:hypothetical protein